MIACVETGSTLHLEKNVMNQSTEIINISNITCKSQRLKDLHLHVWTQDHDHPV